MTEILQDLRYGFRALLRSPLFAVIAILTLGLGIGANTAIFSVVNGVVLRPLGYAEPGNLVSIKSQFPTMGFDRFWVSPPEYLDLQEWSQAFQTIGAYRTGSTSINADERPLRVTSAIASHDLFVALGVDAARGRYFTRDEDLPGGDPATVISDGLWVRAFGSDPDIVGRTVLLDGSPATVVGVMPAGFDIDDAGVDVWQPLQLDPANPGGRGSHYLYLVGRLAPGISVDQGVAELNQLVATWSDRIPGTHTPSPDGHPMIAAGLQDELVGPVRSQLWILLGAVAFVLLIACANVGNLLLARSETRQREVAVRTAMGAPRSRLVRQFLTESVLLAGLGGLAGIALAVAGLRILLAFSSGSIPRLEEIQIDGTVLLVTLFVALGTGLLFGLAPILHLTGGSTRSGLREGGRGSTSGRARQRVRQLLVVGEVALAVVLVVGSGLMLRSFRALTQVDPGFRVEEMLTWQMRLPSADYPNAEDQIGFYRSLQTSLEGAPGIDGMALMSGLPPRRNVNANDTEFEGVERTQDGPAHNVDYYQYVSANYFDVMEIPIVEGRAFNSSDEVSDHPVAIVNERLVRTFYDGQSPIGRRIQPSGGPWLEIVGVARDVKQGGLEEETGTELYFSFAQVGLLTGGNPRSMNVVLRTAGEPTALSGAARAEVARLDGALPMANLQSMDANMAGSLSRPRFLTLLLGVFAGLALTLAAIGTYGVVNYFVAERDREIGIRMAMGAQPRSVLALVMRHGGMLALGGLVVGLLGAYSMSRLMRSLVFEVTTTDAATYALAPALLGVVALAACWVPAWRATRVDPAVVLRED